MLKIPVEAIQRVGLELLCSMRPPDEGTCLETRSSLIFVMNCILWLAFLLYFMECIFWLMYWILCSEFRHFLINHFNTSVSTSRDCFQGIGMRPRGRWFHFPHYPATAHFTRRSVKLCIWLRKVHCFHAYVTTLIEWCAYTITKINVHVLWASWGYCIYFYCEDFVSSCNQTGILYWQLFPMLVIATFVGAVGDALPPTVCCTYHRTNLRKVNAFISWFDTD